MTLGKVTMINGSTMLELQIGRLIFQLVKIRFWCKNNLPFLRIGYDNE
jgi:hypothetical protein